MSRNDGGGGEVAWRSRRVRSSGQARRARAAPAPPLLRRRYRRKPSAASAVRVRHDLQHQGRFADAGIAADQDRGAADQAAAGDPVEFRHAGRAADRLAAPSPPRATKVDPLAASCRKGPCGTSPRETVPRRSSSRRRRRSQLPAPFRKGGSTAGLTDIVADGFRHDGSASEAAARACGWGLRRVPCTNCST